jgi:hypothetical protein
LYISIRPDPILSTSDSTKYATRDSSKSVHHDWLNRLLGANKIEVAPVFDQVQAVVDGGIEAGTDAHVNE